MDPALAARIEAISKWKPLTADDEHVWSQGPLGPREGIYAVWTGDGEVQYFDGADNPLEPGWVLRTLRGTDARPTPTEDLLNHEWMKARKVKGCKRCGRETFRAEQVQSRTEPLRCGGCQYVTGRCKCTPIAALA